MNERTDQTVYWLWLQHALGCGARIADVLRYFDSPRSFWAADENDYRQCDCFGTLRSFSAKRLPLLTDKSLVACNEILLLCERQRISVLTPDDPLYPNRLRPLHDYPAVLFVRGDPACLNAVNAFAVIGAREPTQYALDAAAEIAGSLAQHDCVIVSGGARGIDAAAHEAALAQSKPTVLVMGCGHGSNYLASHAALRRRVASCGALVTEYPPLEPPGPGSFPLRNRLISGLSDALVIIQAGEKSGTLNTAKHAAAQGKERFVLPGSRDSQSFAGSNRLLAEGALAVNYGEDILKRYGVIAQAKQALHAYKSGEPFSELQLQEQALALSAEPKEEQSNKKTTTRKAAVQENTHEKEEKNFIFVPESVSKNAQIVYNILQMQPAQMDALVRSSNLSVPQVLSALTELELCGAVTRDERAVYRCV